METYTRESIREWSASKIAKKAEKLFGEKLSPELPKDELIVAFLKAQKDSNRPESGKPSKPLPSSNGKRPRVRVVFHNQDGPGGADDIFVSVNGRAYLIKREHEVNLPREVMRVIENAEQSVFERGADSRLREKLVKRYSYTTLGEAA